MELVIRQAKPEDAKDVLEYLHQVGGESNHLLFGKDNYHRDLKEQRELIKQYSIDQYSAFYIVLYNDQIVSIGSISSNTKQRISHIARVGLSVKKEFWGNGIATLLMGEMIGFARKNGKTEVIHLFVLTNNHAAISIYKKLGFQKIGKFEKYSKIDDKYYDAIMMNLYL